MSVLLPKSSRTLMSVDFEVHGRVQGVFFRKFCCEAAAARNCVGWVQNTPHGTVRGVVQGRPDDIQSMKVWLSTEGSPLSHIERCEFHEEKAIPALEFPKFSVRH